MGLFTALGAVNGASLTAEELSKKTGADALLISKRTLHIAPHDDAKFKNSKNRASPCSHETT